MTYVLMALDECGHETNCGHFSTETEAFNALPEARENYPEFRSFWVELLKDSNYWRHHYATREAQGFHPDDPDFYDEY